MLSSRLTFGKQQNSEGEKLKQKKRLSFKEPEVEKLWAGSVSGEQQTQHLQHGSGRSTSLENLSLEDEALSIVRNVGSAFVKPTGSNSLRMTERNKHVKKPEREVTQKELLPNEKTAKHRLSPKPEKKEYMRELSPTKPDPPSMKCPAIQFGADSPCRNPASMSEEQQHRLPTIACHQIQMLNYQLEQQRQQTETAMNQIQLLKDQLEAEGAARYKAQMHNHQLMMQNKELLDHIQQLFQQIQELEKKSEDFETRSRVNPPKQEIKEVPQVTPTPGSTQLGYRRNSGTLWSAVSATLTPGAHNQSRRGSSGASLLFQPDGEGAKLTGDSGRRPSFRDESSSRISTSFDTDWRYKRRGSSTLTPPYDPPKSRGNELNVSAEVHSPSSEMAKTQGSSLFVPTLKVTMTENNKEANIEGETRLAISDSLRTNGQTETTSNGQLGFSPIQSGSLIKLFTNQKSGGADDKSVATETGTRGMRKFNKSLDTLKLFN